MILTLAYCDKDICQAIRWMQWVQFLSVQTGLSDISIALITSRWANCRKTHQEIVKLAGDTFKSVQQHTPAVDCEQGWPASPNFMFKEALTLLAGQDVFWMEPDATPTDADWVECFQQEWRLARENGKEFMGSLSRFGQPHMTGIGVYGKRWRDFAPELAAVPSHEPFDHFCGPSVLKTAWITGLVQHRGTEQPVKSLNQLESDAVILHPDKNGSLMIMLDRDMFGGECASIHGWLDRKEPEIMPRQCYHAENTNRAIKAGNLRFVFDSYLCIGGAWQGVYSTENEFEISVLNQLASDPKTSVTSISVEEFEKLTQKKTPISSQEQPPFPRRQEGPITGKGALVVDNPRAVETTAETMAANVVADRIEDVLKIGNVNPSKPEGPKRPPGRPKKQSYVSPL